MKNNAMFIKTEDLRAMRPETRSIREFMELIEDKFTWVKAVAWVDAGFILFGSIECMQGWQACQDYG